MSNTSRCTYLSMFSMPSQEFFLGVNHFIDGNALQKLKHMDICLTSSDEYTEYEDYSSNYATTDLPTSCYGSSTEALSDVNVYDAKSDDIKSDDTKSENDIKSDLSNGNPTTGAVA